MAFSSADSSLSPTPSSLSLPAYFPSRPPTFNLLFPSLEILHYLMKNGMIDGNGMTVTGRTLGENLDRWVHEHGELSMAEQDVIHPLEKPIKETGHLR